MKKRGRPSLYTDKIAAEICERLASGESLRAICRDEKMPAESTVRSWYVDDLNGFAARYARARDIYLDVMADEILDISDDGSNDWMKRENGSVVFDQEAATRSKLRVDTRKWYLSKLAPKRYGDKLQHTGDGEGPIQVMIQRYAENNDPE